MTLKTRLGKVEKTVKSSTPDTREALHVSRLQSSGLYFIQDDIEPGCFDYRKTCRPLAGMPEDFTLTLAQVQAEATRRGRVVVVDFVIIGE